VSKVRTDPFTTHGSAANEQVFHHALTANETTTLKAKRKTHDE
jgi:hypothetical protein